MTVHPLSWLSDDERRDLYTRHRMAARTTRAVFAAAFAATGLLLLPDAPAAGGWWAPPAWPWVFLAGAFLIGQSVVVMRPWADAMAAAAIIVTSAARIVNLLDDPIPAVDEGLFTALALIYWVTLLGVGATWPWLMRPSTLSHRLLRRGRQRAPHDGAD